MRYLFSVVALFTVLCKHLQGEVLALRCLLQDALAHVGRTLCRAPLGSLCTDQDWGLS